MFTMIALLRVSQAICPYSRTGNDWLSVLSWIDSAWLPSPMYLSTLLIIACVTLLVLVKAAIVKSE